MPRLASPRLVLLVLIGTTLANDCNELEDLVNEERGRNGLPALHSDPNMRWVAYRHLEDREEAEAKNIAWPKERDCNTAHSWLVKSPCCYTDDHKNPKCMWDKPLELSGWDKRNGYEISHGWGNPSEAMSYWKRSPHGHYDVILGKGGWSSLKTVGCGFRDGLGAHCWFSKTKLYSGVPEKTEKLPV